MSRLPKSRTFTLLAKYGITEEAYEALAQTQNYKCKICGLHKDDTRYGVLDVDHDHATNLIRGLLCSACNKGLAFFRDDQVRLLKAIQYLKGKL